MGAAAAIRGIRGSSERHHLPVALAVLKLSTGAITAFLGLLLMRGEFVPGLSALDTSAQILAWARVFGYTQQLFNTWSANRARPCWRVSEVPTRLNPILRRRDTPSSLLHQRLHPRTSLLSHQPRYCGMRLLLGPIHTSPTTRPSARRRAHPTANLAPSITRAGWFTFDCLTGMSR